MAKQKKILADASGQRKFFNVPNPFDKDAWLDYADRLGKHVSYVDTETERLAKQNGWLSWDVGDLLLEGERGKVPIKELEAIAAVRFPRHRWKTLRNWKVTARAIEPSRRRDGRGGRDSLSYSLHQVVEKFNPELQDIFLEKASEGRLSIGGLKREIKAYWKSGERVEREPKWVAVTIKVPTREHGWLGALALAKQLHKKKPRNYDDGSGIAGGIPGTLLPDVPSVIWWMAGQYYKEHKAELDAILKQPKS
jgi:hypothetical protein